MGNIPYNIAALMTSHNKDYLYKQQITFTLLCVC